MGLLYFKKKKITSN